MSDVRDLRPYEELQRALDERAASVWPSRDALYRVCTTVRRRRRRRRVAIGSCALVATTVAFASVGGSLHELSRPDRAAISSPPAGRDRVGTQGAVALRSLYGIVGTTKGAAAPASALPDPGGGTGAAGIAESLPKNATSTSVSPGHTTIAVVTKQQQVVVESTAPGSSRKVIGRTKSGAQVSWAPGGTALFAFVGRHWVQVPSSSTDENPRAQVHALRVPRVAGGPSFISVSPGRDVVVLFGVTRIHDAAGRQAARPHVFIGRFNGTRVTHVRPVDTPASAVRGPLGWLGDNAFVVAAGRGAALIVRVHGSPVSVRAALPDACSVEGAPAPCASRGPRLLGTDADGALLYWKVRAEPAPADGAGTAETPAGAVTPPVVFFFSTWLDGSHATRLTGSAGRYGPTLAAR